METDEQDGKKDGKQDPLVGEYLFPRKPGVSFVYVIALRYEVYDLILEPS